MKGGWRSLHNEELHNLYVLTVNEIKGDEIGGVCSTCGGGGKCVQYFSWKA